MGELSFHLDVLKIAMMEAKNIHGPHYQKRAHVLHKVSMLEQQYRKSRNYTYAMWTHHLLMELRDCCLVNDVYSAKQELYSQPPASNTGVNSDESSTWNNEGGL